MSILLIETLLDTCDRVKYVLAIVMQTHIVVTGLSITLVKLDPG